MRIDPATLLLIALLCLPTSFAMADENWVCTYQNPSDIQKPLIARYVIKNGELVGNKANDSYRILQNTQYGIVATSSISDFDPSQGVVTIGASTVLINKKTGDAIVIISMLGEASSEHIRGKCTKA
jgi:hypothetical protein